MPLEQPEEFQKCPLCGLEVPESELQECFICHAVFCQYCAMTDYGRTFLLDTVPRVLFLGRRRQRREGLLITMGRRHDELMEKAESVPVLRSGSDRLLVAQKAEGSRVYDIDNAGYIDYIGAGGATIVGYANQFVLDAVRKVLQGGIPEGFHVPQEVELAQNSQPVPAVGRQLVVLSQPGRGVSQRPPLGPRAHRPEEIPGARRRLPAAGRSSRRRLTSIPRTRSGRSRAGT